LNHPLLTAKDSKASRGARPCWPRRPLAVRIKFRSSGRGCPTGFGKQPGAGGVLCARSEERGSVAAVFRHL